MAPNEGTKQGGRRRAASPDARGSTKRPRTQAEEPAAPARSLMVQSQSNITVDFIRGTGGAFGGFQVSNPNPEQQSQVVTGPFGPNSTAFDIRVEDAPLLTSFLQGHGTGNRIQGVTNRVTSANNIDGRMPNTYEDRVNPRNRPRRRGAPPALMPAPQNEADGPALDRALPDHPRQRNPAQPPQTGAGNSNEQQPPKTKRQRGRRRKRGSNKPEQTTTEGPIRMNDKPMIIAEPKPSILGQDQTEANAQRMEVDRQAQPAVPKGPLCDMARLRRLVERHNMDEIKTEPGTDMTDL